ncbi:MAG: type II and III secretion system protein family protein [Xanthobacteraceae bacterium]|nr:type II and III secretion system protein family protein [Xanthobacteraceae bacterium]MBX9829841.1 type II and III secretion system protein family protein [Xanthobacteraceae bacterium]
MAEMPLIRTTLLLASIAAFGLAAAGSAPAADRVQQTVNVAASDSGSRFVPLGIGKSVVIDLPRDVKDVLVADPKIANAVIRSARRAYIIGSTVGQTNVFFFDHSGQQIIGLDIAVTRDLNGLRAAIRQALPHVDIRVEGLGEGVVLTGVVTSPLEAQTAYDIASRLVDDGRKVVNSITVSGRDQVMLKVTVAEMQRDVIKQLGIDLNGSIGSGTSVLSFNNTNPFPVYGSALVTGNGITSRFNNVNATLRAMERAGVIRTLAEPNLTAISGESANFLAGGEFPVPAGYTCDPVTRNCQYQIQYKKFGVGLNFTPVVLGEGRISLKVMSEVSELSTDNQLTLTQQVSATETTTLTIPSIRTRRAETTVELPSGGALAMAGMIQEQTKQQINGIPGMMQVPILGQLFRSRDFINRQTELVIIVTPYTVRATAQKNLSRPNDGFADAADPQTYLLGRLNRLYGVPSPKPQDKISYTGKYGFILD